MSAREQPIPSNQPSGHDNPSQRVGCIGRRFQQGMSGAVERNTVAVGRIQPAHYVPPLLVISNFKYRSYSCVGRWT